MQYTPSGLPFAVAYWLLFGLLVALIEIGVLQYVFESMGVNRRYMFTLLVFCLLGSYINIPIAELPAASIRAGQMVDFFGVQYVVPVVIHHPGTVIAVNLGGAVLPLMLSLYLVFKHKLYGQSLLAVGIVALAVHLMAHLVPGVGIAVPIFIPPVITALVALSISRWQAGPLAYIAGSLGTLIGADLMNLGNIQGLGAPVASIGGAGKFDGIFLTGIVAVLLAGILGGRWGARREIQIDPWQENRCCSWHERKCTWMSEARNRQEMQGTD
jgi:uncharacterized membrane protein